jgi:single-strand DNA-binding protein
MSGVNRVFLIGRLGKDPEMRYTPSGQPVANFNLATSETWNDKEGQRQEKTEWHRIVVWGKVAELCGQYLNKGREVCTEGKLQTREWTDRDNNKRYTTEIVADRVHFLGSRSDSPGASSGAAAPPRPRQESAAPSFGNGNANGGGAPQQQPRGPSSGQADPAFDYGPAPADDDVPFRSLPRQFKLNN